MSKLTFKDFWIVIGITSLGSGLSALIVEHSGSVVGPLSGLWSAFALLLVHVNGLHRELRRVEEQFVKSPGKI